MGSYLKALLLLIVLVVLVTFGIKNNETLKLYYYLGMSSMPLPVYGVVYASILLGIFIGMLIGVGNRFGQRQKIKALEKENRDLKSKVSEQKPQPPLEEQTRELEPSAAPAEPAPEAESAPEK